jgi:predicted flap endonuclease-1-like 5' DNA nuclease
MGIIATLVIGAVVGAVITWQVDRRQRQKSEQGLQDELAQARGQVSTLRTQQTDTTQLQQQLATAEAQVSELQAQQTEAVQLKTQLAAAEAQIGQLQAQQEGATQRQAEPLEAQAAAASVEGVDEATNQPGELVMDQLEVVKGIGPTYARRLNEAGILTYTDLAQQTPERIRELVGGAWLDDAEVQQWIEEAQSLAGREAGE